MPDIKLLIAEASTSQTPLYKHCQLHEEPGGLAHECPLKKAWVTWITARVDDPAFPFQYFNSHPYILNMSIKSEPVKLKAPPPFHPNEGRIPSLHT